VSCLSGIHGKGGGPTAGRAAFGNALPRRRGRREVGMKLTRASSYALHAVAFMAAQKNEKPVASHKIAQDRGIPHRFLLKVRKPLGSARVLTSVKGPNGGYKLARPAADISMLEILEAVDGPIRGQAPFDAKSNPALNNKIEDICNASAEVVRKTLDKIH